MSTRLKKLAQLIAVGAIGVGLVFSASACSQTPLAEKNQQFGKNPAVVEKTLDSLNAAKSIRIQKKSISIGDRWKVEADGKRIATIEGRNIPLLGDTYSMYAIDGTFIGAEQEQPKILSGAKANTYTFEAKKTGSIRAQVLSVGYRFIVSDANEDKVGVFQQGLSFTMGGNITNAQGRSEWHMTKNVFMDIGYDTSVTLKNKADGKNQVSALNAIWITAIVSEISEHE